MLICVTQTFTIVARLTPSIERTIHKVGLDKLAFEAEIFDVGYRVQVHWSWWLSFCVFDSDRKFQCRTRDFKTSRIVHPSAKSDLDIAVKTAQAY